MYTRLGMVAPLIAVMGMLALAPPAGAVQHHYFSITVIDKVSAQPIAGIKLTTTNSIVFASDATGKVPFYEPGLMGTSVWFSLGSCSIPQGQTQGTCVNGSGSATTCTSHADCNLGYSPPTGFLGIVGVGFTASEQGTATIRMCPPGGGCTPDAVTGAPAPAPTPLPSQMFKIAVVDQSTGRGVPLIEVRSSTQTYVTDSGGLVAFYDAARMGTTVHFDVSGHGYALTAADLLAAAGGNATVQIARVNLAERLYRVTGGGIYHDTVLLEQSAPLQYPVLNSQVFGQDSAGTTVYQGKIFWVWGDTGRPSFPLGNFRTTGATSLLPGQGGLDPSVGVNLAYYGDGAGFVAQMCPASTVPPPPGYSNLLCWMGSLAAVPDGGVERLFGRYVLVAGVGIAAEQGLVRFNDATSVFEKVLVFDGTEKVNPIGHTLKITHGSSTYVYYPYRGVTGAFASIDVDNPTRIPATAASMLDKTSYEAFTALQQGSSSVLETNPDGTLHYTWKTGTSPISGGSAVAPQVPSDQRLFGHQQDPNSGAAPRIVGTSTGWNAYRQRFVQIFQQTFGSSFLGELWVNEADTPMGPWVYVRKIVTHNNYSFYNVRSHPYFDQERGKKTYFEATYTTYLTNSTPTPRDNYNQVMYRLDMDTPGVVLPVAVYDLSQATVPGAFVTKRGLRPTTPDSTAVFFALDRSGMAETVPVYWNDAACAARQLVVGGTPVTEPVFYALPASTPSPPASTVPLYEYVNGSTGQRAYSTNPALVLPGFTRNTDPLALVWANPIRVTLPVASYLPTLIADAGADQCKQEPVPGSGYNVTLNGSQTVVPAGVTPTYAWTYPGGSASGVSPTVTLHAGVNLVTLTVTGSDGQLSTDTTVVNVAACPSGCC